MKLHPTCAVHRFYATEVAPSEPSTRPEEDQDDCSDYRAGEDKSFHFVKLCSRTNTDRTRLLDYQNESTGGGNGGNGVRFK
uniref:Uncharacterized protein n=1 Tax=Anopheles atroparvus TaxID=41427 RepID=A0AAG5DXL3_ANOAO